MTPLLWVTYYCEQGSNTAKNTSPAKWCFVQISVGLWTHHYLCPLEITIPSCQWQMTRPLLLRPDMFLVRALISLSNKNILRGSKNVEIQRKMGTYCFSYSSMFNTENILFSSCHNITNYCFKNPEGRHIQCRTLENLKNLSKFFFCKNAWRGQKII